MLDSHIVEQLKTVFAKLENIIELVYCDCEHEDQQNLIDLLKSVESTSDKLIVRASSISSRTPSFHLEYNGAFNGVSFKGIPNGHEFTSLILAILHSDGKGKFPDDMIIDRIKKLKGPIKLRTFISLSCENCPEVIQSLNLMAIIHGNFHHEMIDGAYVQDELASLGVQGVPSVMQENTLLSSGKIQFIDLLTKLESSFGIEEATNLKSADLGFYDVVVIGGGPAGASAAIYSARKGSSTLLLSERFGGQVQDTKGIENLISVKYTEGPQLAAQLMQHIAEYPVKVLEHRRVLSISKDQIKKIVLESGEIIKAKSVIITTGAKWRELGILGEKEYIGRGVAFCPHCDGPYYKGKNIAVVGGGNSGVEAAIDLAGIVNSVFLFEFQDQLKADKFLVDKLNSIPNVTVITNAKTQKVIGNGQKVIGIEYVDRKTDQVFTQDLDGIFVQIGLLPNSQFVKETVELTKSGEIVIDNKGRTSVPGIYAAGDVTTVPFKQIIIAMGEGAKAALSAFEDQMYQV